MIKRRRDLDLVSELDLYRAQTQVDAARRDVASFIQLVAQDKNALDLLLGVPASDELLPTELSGVIPPKEISPGLSSEVLLRRPDVLQAEDLLKAANADIGAARAAFFPRISLTAAIGSASSDLSDSSRPARVRGAMRRRLSCRFSMLARGRRTGQPKCNGKSP